MDNKSTLKKDRYDILIDLIQHGINKYGGFRESSFAGKYDGVYILDLYKKVESESNSNDSIQKTNNEK